MSLIRLQLEAVGLGHMWADADLDRIAEELDRRRVFAGDGTAGGRTLELAAGLVEFWRGRFAASLSILEEVSAAADARGDVAAVMISQAAIGLIASFRGDDELSAEAFATILALSDRHGAPAVELMARGIRITTLDVPEWSLVEGEITRCRELAAELDPELFGSMVDLAEGWALASNGRFGEAEKVLGAAVDGMSAPLERAIAQLRRSEVLALDGRSDEAAEAAAEALGTFETWHARYWAVRAALVLATLERDRGGRRVAAALAGLPDDPAYVRLLAPTAEFVIDLRNGPAVRRAGEPVVFLTRHAEAAVRLLAAAGPKGMTMDELAGLLWPGADPERVGQRFRTMLWQVRSGLGGESWRLQRRRDVVTLDVTGLEVVGRLDRKALAQAFS